MSYFLKIWMKQQSILKFADPVPNQSVMGSVPGLIDSFFLSFSAHCFRERDSLHIVELLVSGSQHLMSQCRPTSWMPCLTDIVDIYRYLYQLLPLTFACIFLSFQTSDVCMATWLVLEKPRGYSTNTSIGSSGAERSCIHLLEVSNT